MRSFIDNIMKNKKHKRKSYCNTNSMGINIDKNEYYEIILSNSAHPEIITNNGTPSTQTSN